MSFDEKQQLDNDEIDLVYLFKIIWRFRYGLLVFIIMSIPISLWVCSILKPTYKAETVFEKPGGKVQSSGSLLNSVQSSGVASFFGSGILGGETDSFFSEIRSESFLRTVIFNNAELDSQMMQKLCPLPSKETSRFSLRSFLILLGISEDKAPSQSQKIFLLVQCVNGMLEVDYDRGGSGESSAFRLSIESEDPEFSANLANQIVEKYFIRHERNSTRDYQNVKKYLSKVITEAQLEYTEANKLIQSFLIKHTPLMNIEISSSQNISPIILTIPMKIPPSPFVSELNKEIANLSQLEKSLSDLNRARLLFSNLKEMDHEKIKTFISSNDVQGVLSRSFLTALAKINNISTEALAINQEIKKIVSRELASLKQQMQVLEENIVKREEQTKQLMNIENRFQELALDVSKKKLVFELLKDQLKEKILTTGLANVDQPVLLTRAVPPFRRAFPNKRLIVALGVMISLFVGIAYALFRQSSLRKVCSLSQIQGLTNFLRIYKIKYRQLKQMGKRSDETVISQSFFSLAMEMGKCGCIVDLSQKKRSNSLASEFSESVSSLLATEYSKIVCLDTSLSKKTFTASSKKNFASDYSNLNAQETSNKNILSFYDVDGMIGAGEIKKIKNKYSEFDKIICVLGAEIGDLTKFKFIEQCDFYILIGRSFQFDEFTYKKFSNAVWEKEKKCLGFFLID